MTNGESVIRDGRRLRPGWSVVGLRASQTICIASTVPLTDSNAHEFRKVMFYAAAHKPHARVATPMVRKSLAIFTLSSGVSNAMSIVKRSTLGRAVMNARALEVALRYDGFSGISCNVLCILSTMARRRGGVRDLPNSNLTVDRGIDWMISHFSAEFVDEFHAWVN